MNKGKRSRRLLSSAVLMTIAIGSAVLPNFAGATYGTPPACGTEQDCFAQGDLRDALAKQKFDQGMMQKTLADQKFQQGVMQQTLADQRFREGRGDEAKFLAAAAQDNFNQAKFLSAAADANFNQAEFISAAANGDYERGGSLLPDVADALDAADARAAADAEEAAAAQGDPVATAARAKRHCKPGPQVHTEYPFDYFGRIVFKGDLGITQFCHQGLSVNFGSGDWYQHPDISGTYLHESVREEKSEVLKGPSHYEWSRGPNSGMLVWVRHRWNLCVGVPKLGWRCPYRVEVFMHVHVHEDGTCYASAKWRVPGPDPANRKSTKCGKI